MGRCLVAAWAAQPPSTATPAILRWPELYVIDKRQLDALFDRRMAVKSKMPFTHWLKSFGRVYATHHRHWNKACTTIADALNVASPPP